MSNMDSVQELIAAGERLGYKDDGLKKYVSDQQKFQREERAEIRQKEKDEREHQLMMERLYYEMKMKELEEEHELEMTERTARGKAVDAMVKPNLPKIPPFEENKDEIDSYLRRFERYATAMGWEKSLWSTHLSALLKGRALDVYALMSTAKVSDYDELKAALLREVDNARKPHDPDPEWKPNTVSTVETRKQVKDKQKAYPPLKVPEIVKEEIGPEDILREQQADPSLETARQYAREGRTSRDGKVKWIERKGLLYREYEGLEKDRGKTYCQLIVPAKFRHIVMKLAHESIMSGHLAIQRTISRILSEFFWPGMQSEIKRFCQSCDTCQRTVSKGKVSKVPLDSMPLIDVPFKRVAVDIVGPLHPPTDKGNRFILTLVDYATRFPQAKALPGIDTERVAESLLEMFSYTGTPEEILTDMGSQFTSGLMKEVSRLISLKQLTTTPYHPMCNGLVERFNGTLKQMLKRMCIDRPKDWDKYLPTVLFAYREVPQESLGFAPFELLYGRTVRGPMTILKELWTKEIQDQQVKSTYQYVLDLRERLESTWELAQENLKKATHRHKVYFDKKARVRNMKPGEKVLVLLPSDSNKLLMQWQGPYQIVKRLGKVDYQLEVKGKVKTYHANMLKKYVERCEPVVDCVMSVVDSEQIDDSDVECSQETDFLEVQSRETHVDVDVNPELSREEKQKMKELLYRYSDVLSDVPGHTHVLEHEIWSTTDRPVRVSPRQIPFAMMDTVKDEVSKMLEFGVIEPSDSPYSSPIVLVVKKDYTYRFCVDFRALNRITVFDAEPMPDVDAMFAKLSGHNTSNFLSSHA
ncbi:uncharacterized protein LOC128160712 [Crassostrea angulata]|uniref:uncharacterized protein LOC128160712 n=1 Tax=Magallana angulata TaxID=2784310 RepID=UPI0022B1AA01|nr:uncharacterized protein LOC128160712 [Crassostrea angulata]